MKLFAVQSSSTRVFELTSSVGVDEDEKAAESLSQRADGDLQGIKMTFLWLSASNLDKDLTHKPMSIFVRLTTGENNNRTLKNRSKNVGLGLEITKAAQKIA